MLPISRGVAATPWPTGACLPLVERQQMQFRGHHAGCGAELDEHAFLVRQFTIRRGATTDDDPQGN